MTNFETTRRNFLEMAASISAAKVAVGVAPTFASAESAIGTVTTVTGDIPASELRFTLMHEHVYSNFEGYYEETLPMQKKVNKDLYFATDPQKPVEMEDLGYLNMGGFVFSRDA